MFLIDLLVIAPSRATKKQMAMDEERKLEEDQRVANCNINANFFRSFSIENAERMENSPGKRMIFD